MVSASPDSERRQLSLTSRNVPITGLASDRRTDYGAVSVFGMLLPPSAWRSASTSLSR